jgi:hypothetical protein
VRIITQSNLGKENVMHQQSGWQIIWPDSGYGEQYVLDVAGGSTQPGAGIVLYGQSNSRESQLWNIYPAKDDPGYFYIGNKKSQLVLTVTAEIPGNGAQVFQTGLDNSDAQKWRFAPAGDPHSLFDYVFNKFSGLVLDLEENRIADGTPILQYIQNGGRNQYWRGGQL